jgi:RNA polymerase sigma-70 factor (ECF subfamily)
VDEKAEVLLQRARSGDVEAFASLFESFREIVFRAACRLVGEVEAEDVVMDTYLKAWQALPRFGGRASLKTWLYRIAHNCSVDHLRARQRDAKRFVRESELDPDHPSDFPDVRQVPAGEILGNEETAQTVRQALEQVTADHRVALLMRYADGLSYTEIAAATGVSIGTVMSRLFYGKRKLKEVMREWHKREEG